MLIDSNTEVAVLILRHRIAYFYGVENDIGFFNVIILCISKTKDPVDNHGIRLLLLNESESRRTIIYFDYVKLDTKVFNKLLESYGVNPFAQKGHGLPFQVKYCLYPASRPSIDDPPVV